MALSWVVLHFGMAMGRGHCSSSSSSSSKKPVAMNALALLLAMLLLLLPPTSVAQEQDEASLQNLFAHIREVQELNINGFGELAKFNAKRPEDLSVADPVAGVGAEEKLGEGDAPDLFAHIFELQRKALERNAEIEGLSDEERKKLGFESEEEDEEEEKEAEVEGEKGSEGSGMADPLVQARMKQLEETLKGLTDRAVDNQGELNADGPQLTADGAKGEDVINLLHKYAYEMHQKLHPNAADGELQMGTESNHEVAAEEEKSHGGHEENHVDHEHSLKHDHHHDRGHEEHHHHHDHGHRDEHANVGFSKASDAHCHHHDHSGHSHGHQHGESVKKREFRLPEEIAEEEDLLHYGFEGHVYSSDEQSSRFPVPELGSISFLTRNFNVYICAVHSLFIHCRMMYSFRGDTMCVGSSQVLEGLFQTSSSGLKVRRIRIQTEWR